MKPGRKNLLALALMLTATAVVSSCRRETSPASVFQTYYEAALKRDVEGMKKTLSKDALKYFAETARHARMTPEEGLRANAEAMPQQMPETHATVILEDRATLEIRDAKTDRRETVEFVKEDGAWKIALDRAVNRQ
jgi:uncharacterized protein YchJ